MPESKKTKKKKSKALWEHRHNRLGLILVVFVFAIAGYFLLFSKAAPAPPSVYITPPSPVFPGSTNFSVQVRENSGTTAVNAVQANFSYPTALVTFVSIDNSSSAFPTADSLSTGGSGAVSLAGGVSTTTGSAVPVTGDQLIAVVNFKTNTTSGTANLTFTTGTALVSSSTNTDLLGGLGATTGASFAVDVTPPTTTLTAPTNGATVSNGSNVTITATATDANSVASVGIYIDGTLKTTLSASPYTYTWSTTGVSLGSHTIQAKATDGVGNVGSSAINTVTVADQTAPTVSITAPTGGSTQKGTVTVNATATDNTGGTGVAKVEFYVDGALASTDTASPYSFSWNTTGVTDGSHSLTAKAYDGAATPNVSTTSATNVIVDNNPPTTPGTFHVTGVTNTSVSLAWTASTDTVGVTGYRIQRNGNTVTTTGGSTLAFTDTGLTQGTAYNYTVAAVDAAGNVSTTAAVVGTTTAPKPGDTNGDGHVDITDLSVFLSNYGTTTASCDFNHDGTVNILDLSIMLTNYGT